MNTNVQECGKSAEHMPVCINTIFLLLTVDTISVAASSACCLGFNAIMNYNLGIISQNKTLSLSVIYQGLSHNN